MKEKTIRRSPFWRTWFPVLTGTFVRDYLLAHEKAYPYEVFKALRERLLEEGYPKRGMMWGSYQNMRNYFYWLEKLGLIEFVEETPGSNPLMKSRRLYRLTPKGLALPPESIEWTNPRRALYPESWETYH
jgi:DNA-binding PadR family transcriptional regulator